MYDPINKSIRSPFLWLGILLLVTTILYAGVTGFSYITGGDQDLITRNLLLDVTGGIDVWEILTSQVAGTYQPLSLLSLVLDMSIMPKNPSSVIHLGNLILHLVNVMLFFLFCRKLSGNGSVALFMAGIMALHPVNIAAVAWMSSRGVLLSSALMLVGGLQFLYLNRSGRGIMSWSVVVYVLALLSHPMAIIYPMALVLIELYQGHSWKAALKSKTVYFVLSGVALLIAVTLNMNEASGAGQNLIKLLYFPYVAVIMFASFVVPLNLSAFPVTAGHWSFIIAGFAGIALSFVGAAMISRQRGIKALYPLIFYILTILLAVFVSWNNRVGTGNQYMYIGGAGLIMMIGGILSYLIERFKSNRLILFSAVVMAVSILIILAGITRSRMNIWRNGETFWTDVIRHHPDASQAFFLRGDYFALNGDMEKARFDYQQCIKRDPEAYMAMNNLGLTFLEENDLPMALAEFDRSIDVKGDFYMSRLNRGITLMRLGKNEEALESMNTAVSLNPAEPLAYYNRGLIYERMNALDNAIGDFSTAIRLNPAMLQFYKDRGKAYVWKKDYVAAEDDYTTILERDPQNAEMWFRRSLARSSQNNFEGALADALKARSLGFTVEEEYIRGISMQVFKDKLPAEN